MILCGLSTSNTIIGKPLSTQLPIVSILKVNAIDQPRSVGLVNLPQTDKDNHIVVVNIGIQYKISGVCVLLRTVI